MARVARRYNIGSNNEGMGTGVVGGVGDGCRLNLGNILVWEKCRGAAKPGRWLALDSMWKWISLAWLLRCASTPWPQSSFYLLPF